jgi:hypothetical protein
MTVHQKCVTAGHLGIGSGLGGPDSRPKGDRLATGKSEASNQDPPKELCFPYLPATLRVAMWAGLPNGLWLRWRVLPSHMQSGPGFEN